MTVTVNLTVDDQVVAVTIADPTAYEATPADPDVWDVTTALQVPQPPPWEASASGGGTGSATGDTTVTATAVATGTGEGRAVLPATWTEFEAAYPTWADRNGLTWAQLTALETGA